MKALHDEPPRSGSVGRVAACGVASRRPLPSREAEAEPLGTPLVARRMSRFITDASCSAARSDAVSGERAASGEEATETPREARDVASAREATEGAR